MPSATDEDWEEILDLWSLYHPAQAEEVLLEEEIPRIPSIDCLPPVVDYSTRGAKDWVVSGPLGVGQGPGRRFNSELEAFRWAAEKYGRNRVSRVDAGGYRWAILVRAA